MARRKKGSAKAYGWDRVIGGLGVLFDVLSLLFVCGFAYLSATDPKIKSELAKQFGTLKPLGGPFEVISKGGLLGIGVVAIALAVVHLSVNIGIFRSQKWAFVAGALLAGYHLGVGGYGYGAFLLTYTVLRLGQVFGPTLR